MRVTVIPDVIGEPGTIPKGAGRVGNRRTSSDHSNYCIKIVQNSEKGPGHLKRLAITQTLVKYH